MGPHTFKMSLFAHTTDGRIHECRVEKITKENYTSAVYSGLNALLQNNGESRLAVSPKDQSEIEKLRSEDITRLVVDLRPIRPTVTL